MNKIKNLIAVILTVMIVLPALLAVLPAEAASATVNFSTDSTIVSKGNSLTVSLIISADETIGEFEGFITYNSDLLEFKDGGSCISGGDGVIRISDTEAPEASTKRKYAMKFKAKETGSCTFAMSGKPMVYTYEDGAEMSVSNNEVSINIKAAKRVSQDTSLADLKISPGKLLPEFNAKTYQYTTSVDENTTQLIVSAKTNDSAASVTIKGNTKLSYGENEVILTVKAESGDTKEYIIMADKEEPSDVPDETEEENPDGIKAPQVTIKENEIILEGNYRYKIAELDNEAVIPEGYVKSEFVIDGQAIESYSRENSLEEDFLLLYAMNQNGEKGFYQYDRSEKTLQRYQAPVSITSDENQTTGDSMTAKEYNAKLGQLSFIIAILSALSALLLIMIIGLYLKTKGYKDDELD